MGIITDDLIAEMAENLGIEISDTSVEMTTARAINYLNRAYWKLLDKFPFREKEDSFSFPTIVGQRTYDINPPFEALRQLSILNPTSRIYTPLTRGSIYTEEIDRDETVNTEAYGFPVSYVREKNRIRLRPIPDDVYSVNVKHWTLLDDLDIGNYPNMPRSWHEIVLYGGTARAFFALKDYSSANTFFNMAAGETNTSVPIEAKEEVDSHTSGLEVLGRDSCDWR